MKNLTILLIILLAAIQLETKAQVSIGLLGGINIADLRSELNVIESSSLLGFGGIIEYNFTDEFSIVAEPMYLQKGGVQSQSEFDPEIEINLSYFEMPLLLKYKFDFSDIFQPYIVAGATAGYRLSAEMTANMNMMAYTADLKNVSKEYDLGLTIGAGLEIPLEGIFILLEGRYSHGMIDIHQNGDFTAVGGGTTIRDTFDDDDWFKSTGFQFMFGFKFPIGG